ncbi:hypothetical protein EVAR_102488_1 [Eumeta japonica]|uniref:Uncharacterized protein n=1 Tax=Eumeta variegata TaxID=151549 RepID=A0A4C1T3R8_EUMVA|nr:hypothetical protein EVAR_102488_1 [Eumeta japonica]
MLGWHETCLISVNPLESIFNSLDRDLQWRGRFEGQRFIKLRDVAFAAVPAGRPGGGSVPIKSASEAAVRGSPLFLRCDRSPWATRLV